MLGRRVSLICLLVFLTRVASAQVIDSHVHLFSPQNFGTDSITANDVIAMMDQAKIDRAVVLSAAYWFSQKEKAQIENNFVAAEVAKHSERLVGFCAVNLVQDWAVDEIERCGHQLKLRGLKLHPQFDKADFRNPDHLSRMDAILDKAAKFDLPVLLDSNGWDIKGGIQLRSTSIETSQGQRHLLPTRSWNVSAIWQSPSCSTKRTPRPSGTFM